MPLARELSLRDRGNPPRFDAMLADDIDPRVGPLIALNDPADVLPRKGAARMHCRADEWQEEVEGLLSRAQLVLVVEGTSAGLRWELAAIRRVVPPFKVVFLTLPAAFRGSGTLPWLLFSEQARSLGYAIPESHPGDGVIFTLTAIGMRWQSREDWCTVSSTRTNY